MKHKITAEDLELNPELKEHCKVGDIIELVPVTAKITPEYYTEDDEPSNDAGGRPGDRNKPKKP